MVYWPTVPSLLRVRASGLLLPRFILGTYFISPFFNRFKL